MTKDRLTRKIRAFARRTTGSIVLQARDFGQIAEVNGYTDVVMTVRVGGDDWCPGQRIYRVTASDGMGRYVADIVRGGRYSVWGAKPLWECPWYSRIKLAINTIVEASVTKRRKEWKR